MANSLPIDLFNVYEASLIAPSQVLRINASNLKCANKFRARGVAITAVVLRVNAVSTPPVCQVSIQSDDGTGKPSGTVLGTTTTTFTPAAGVAAITLANSYTPTVGDLLHAVIEYSSGTVDSTHYAEFNTSGVAANWANQSLTFNGTTWSTVNGFWPAIGIECSDGIAHPWLDTPPTQTATAYNSGSSPDEYALQFIAPAAMTVLGFHVYKSTFGSSWPGTWKPTLYDSNSNSLLGTDNVSLAAADDSNTGSFAHFFVPITSVSLTAGSTYYVGVLPLTTTNVEILKLTFPDAASLAAVFGSITGLVSRTNSGAWSAADVTSCFAISPVVKDVTPGGAAGILVHPGMSGRMAG